MVFIYGIGLVLSCQIQDDLSPYYNKHQHQRRRQDDWYSTAEPTNCTGNTYMKRAIGKKFFLFVITGLTVDILHYHDSIQMLQNCYCLVAILLLLVIFTGHFELLDICMSYGAQIKITTNVFSLHLMEALSFTVTFHDFHACLASTWISHLYHIMISLNFKSYFFGPTAMQLYLGNNNLF